MGSSVSGSRQPVLLPEPALAEVAALEVDLASDEVARSAAHAAQLARVLAFAAACELAGYGSAAPAHLALVLSCSEWRAHDLLEQAAVLDALPGAVEHLQAGGLTVEQWATVARLLSPLAGDDAALVWERLLVRLAAERARGVAHPPARLAELVRRLIAELLPAELAEQRRRNGTGPAGDDVTYERNDDGSANIHLLGMSAPNAQAALSNIAARSEPWGPWDQRSPGRRRLDAATDLLTGRQALPCPEHPAEAGEDPVPATTCRCPAGSSAPCGADVRVLVPLATALGLSDVPGELIGHGPIDVEQLATLLARGPSLSAVHVDAHGVPVGVGDTAVDVPPDDPAALRTALVEVAAQRPGERFPTHPHDHPPPEPGQSPCDDVTGGPHTGGPGPYSIRPRLRRLLQLRTLRCEWPGCGARAARCDLDHDDAWPHGPTCACNLGALCRHHHRIKQLGWIKNRLPDGSVQWTSPTGSSFTSPAQLPAVPEVGRPLPALPEPPEELSPLQEEQELRFATPDDPCWDDPRDWLPRHPDHDRVRAAIETGDTRWTLDLHDPYRWMEPPP